MSSLIEQALARAESACASSDGDGDGQSVEQEHLCAQIGERVYAIESHWVKEVSEVRPLTPLPHMPAYLSSVFTLRGKALPLLDLGKFLGDTHTVPATRFIVVAHEQLLAGLPATKIVGIVRWRRAAQRPALPGMQKLGSFVTGHFLAEESLFLRLDVAQLLHTVRAQAAGAP